MYAKLSSRGQLVIPKSLREKLGLRAGTKLHIFIEGDKLVLIPQEREKPLDLLYGRYRDLDLLADLEAEHKAELELEVEAEL